MVSWSAQALVKRAEGQRNIRRNCTCGRTIFGNPGWWSHTHHRDGTERDGHRFDGVGR